MQIVIGAVVFAAGMFCGVVAVCTGAELQKKQSGRKFQDAFLSAMEKTNGRESH